MHVCQTECSLVTGRVWKCLAQVLHVLSLLHAPNFVSDSRNLILERLKLQNVTTYIYTEIARDQYLECSRATECSRIVVQS